MVVMASLLGAQELRVSITTDSSVSVKDAGFFLSQLGMRPRLCQLGKIRVVFGII